MISELNLYIRTIRATILLFPDVVPLLKGRARWVAMSFPYGPYAMRGYYSPRFHPSMEKDILEGKTVDFFLSTLERLVRSVYNGDLGGEFIDILASLIYGQLDQAYRQAWNDEGDDGEYPEYLADSFEEMYLNQFDFVDNYYRDIVDARVDETPIEPLLARAQQWAGQWNAAYKEAVQLIRFESGGNLAWRKGDTEKGCSTCASLDGIIAPARTWEALGVHPRGYPNDKLDCEGGGPANNCDCTLEETDERATRGAYDKIVSIISKG